MNKHTSKLLSVLLAVCLLLTVAPTAGLMSFAEEKAYSTGDYVIFGSYPQDEVNSYDPVYAELQKLPKSWKSYRYYSGNSEGFSLEPEDPIRDGKMQPGDFMYYADVVYEGERYRAVRIDENRPEDVGVRASSAGSIQKTNRYVTGTVYYFQFKPLAWRVLDPETGLVLCANLIDSQPFNNTIYYGNGEFWQTAEKKDSANNYEKSSIRQWLLNDFYSTAFTKTEQSKIGTTLLDNNLNTRDKIFLLSSGDATNPAYGFSDSSLQNDGARMAYGTAYAKCQGLAVDDIQRSPGYTRCYWWLRTPAANSTSAFLAGDLGSVGTFYQTQSVANTFCGVRPAFCFQGAIEDSWNLSEAPGVPFENGDVSGDGKIMAEDARLALRAAVGLERYKANSAQFLAADVNGDNTVTAEDARLILRAAVGLEILKASAPTKSETAAAMKAYQEEVIRARASDENNASVCFTLYDFDENGMPELILEFSNRYGNVYDFYTYTKQNALVALGSVRGFSDVFVDRIKGDNAFDFEYTRHDRSWVSRYRIENNRIVEATLIGSHIQRTGDFIYDKEYEILQDDVFLKASDAETYFQDLI